MKDTRPIAAQVAELTPEQKKSVRRVGICFDVVMCAVLLVYIVVAVVFMVQLNTVNRELNNFTFTKTETVEGVEVQRYDPEAELRFAQLATRQERITGAFVTTAGIGFVAVLAVLGTGLLIIAVKFPYYSDKRFVYIGKMNRKAKK